MGENSKAQGPYSQPRPGTQYNMPNDGVKPYIPPMSGSTEIRRGLKFNQSVDAAKWQQVMGKYMAFPHTNF